MSEWKETTIGKITDWYSGGTPSKSNEDFWNGDIPWATAKSLVKPTICDTEIKITEKGLVSGSRMANINDILLLVRGSGLYNDIPISLVTAPIAFNQDIKALRMKKDTDIESEYLFYWLIANKKQLNRVLESTGIGAGKFDTNVIKSLTLKVPPKAERKAIIRTAYCLFAKIENLRKQNNTLEQIAQTLFKHWFIDFEFPNTDGKPYKSSGGEMQSSVLGDIPKGWRVGKLRDIMILHYGKSLISNTRIKGNYPVVGSSGIVDTHDNFFVTGPGIVIGRKGTIGKVIWLEENFYPIDTTFYIENILECEGLYFHYFLLKNQNFNKLTSDSAVPGLNRDMAYSVEVIISDNILINKYNLVVKTCFDKLKVNSTQIQTLTKIRDALLPKLMSGQIRIEE